MIHEIECFFAYYPNTIAAITAIGTLLAVVAAVWIATDSKKLKLKAYASVWVVYSGNIPDEQRPRHIQVSITNSGSQSAWLGWLFFNWSFPFDKTNCSVTPIAPEKFPLEVSANRNILVPLSPLQVFREEVPRITTHLRWGKGLRLKYCRAFVYTEDGKKFPVIIAPNLRKEFIELANKLTNSGKTN